MVNKKTMMWKSSDMDKSTGSDMVRDMKNKPVNDFSFVKFKYLRGHWLENTLDGFRVKNGHSSGSRGVVCSAQSEQPSRYMNH